jgi:hypothetical protein
MEELYSIDLMKTQIEHLKQEINMKDGLIQQISQRLDHSVANERVQAGQRRTLESIVQNLLKLVEEGTIRNSNEIEEAIDEIINLYGLDVASYVTVSVDVTHTMKLRVGRGDDLNDIINGISFASSDSSIDSDECEIDENSIRELR